jgi:hypothetical protein
MIEGFEYPRGQESIDPKFRGWRIIASAWALALMLVISLAGARALACLHPGPQPHAHRHLAGAVIPQHDACVGPGVPSAPGIDGCQIIPVHKDSTAYW